METAVRVDVVVFVDVLEEVDVIVLINPLTSKFLSIGGGSPTLNDIKKRSSSIILLID